MKFDMLNYRYPSRRSVIYGRKGMVCTSQPLAAQAGLDILKKGGNAVDAMIATAICMTVLEPTGNGLGSDAFDLVWFGGKLYGLNGSGGAPKLQTLEKMKAKGYDSMPQRGWDSVTVPGAVSAWGELHRRFGRLPFKELFAAAIDYAENGYPVHPIVGRLWNDAAKVFMPFRDKPEFRPFLETFLKNGAPAVGSVVKLPDHARTLRELAETNCEASTAAESPRRSTRSRKRRAVSCAPRTWRRTGPNGSNRSEPTTKATKSAKFRPTATASSR